MQMPFSQACENNKDPILAILRQAFTATARVLEIGSGTGQHAVYFSAALPHLIWQASDRRENLAGIQLRFSESCSKNLLPPVELDVGQTQWPTHFDAVFSANTAHIMPWRTTQMMIGEVARRLPDAGLFALYGPFNYHGQYTSESNRVFDLSLKSRNSGEGIRDFEPVNQLAKEAGLTLLKDHAMPANNRLLLWKKMI